MANEGRATLELTLKIAEAELKKLGKVRKGIEDLDKAAEELEGQDLELDTKGLDKAQAELEETVRDTKALIKEGDRLEKEFSRATRALEKATKRINFDPASKSTQRLRAEVDRAGRAMLDFGQKSGKALNATEKELRDVEEVSKRARTEFRRFQNEAKPGKFSQLIKTFGQLKVAVGAFLGAIIVRKLVELSAAAVKTSQDLGRLKNALNAVEGVNADTVLARVAERADTLGLSLIDLEKQTTSFVVAGTRLGLTLEQSLAVIEGFSVASVGAGKSQEELNRALRQVEQGLAKGKFEMQDFKIIMEVIPGVAQALSKGLNITTEELFQLQKKGLIPAKEAALILAAELPKLFGDAVQKNAADFRSQVQRLKNEVVLFGREVAEKVIPELEEWLRLFRELGKEGPDSASLVSNIVTGVSDALQQVVRTVAAFVTGDWAGFWDEAILVYKQFLLDLAIANEKLIGILNVGGIFDELLAKQAKAIESFNQDVVDQQKKIQDRLTDIASGGAKDRVKLLEEEQKDRERIAKEALEDGKRNQEELNRAFEDSLREQTDSAKDAARDRAQAREESVREQLDNERHVTEELVSEFKERAEGFNVAEKDRVEVVREVTETLVELERDAAERRSEIIRKGAADAETATESKRKEILERVAEALIKVEEDLQKKRSDIAKKGIEKLEDLEEKRVEAAKKANKKILEEQEKLQGKIQDLIEESQEKVRELFDELGESFQGPDLVGSADADEQIADLQEEINKIQAKTFLDPEDLNRVDELRRKIFSLKRGVGAANESFEELTRSLADDSAKAGEALEGLIDEESFRTAFQGLSDAEQSALKPMIADFLAAGEAGTLTGANVRELEGLFESLGLTGPTAVEDILDSLDRLGEPTEANKRLEELAAEAAKLKEKMEPAATAAKQLAENVDDITRNMTSSVDAMEDGGEAANTASKGFGELGEALNSLPEDSPLSGIKEDLQGIATATEGLPDKVAGAVGVFAENAEGLQAAQKVTGALAISLPAIGEGLTQAQAALVVLAPLVPALITAIADAQETGSFDAVKELVTELAEKAPLAGEGLEKAKTALEGLNTAASGEEAEQLKKLIPELASEENLAKLAQLVTGLEGVSTQLSASKDDVTELLAKMKEGAADGGEIDQLIEKLLELVDFLEKKIGPAVAKAVAEIAKLERKLGDAKDKLDGLLEGLRTGLPAATAAGVAASIPEIDKLISKLDEALAKIAEVRAA